MKDDQDYSIDWLCFNSLSWFCFRILVNNALADMFLGDSEWIGAIAGTVGHLVVFLLVSLKNQ